MWALELEVPITWAHTLNASLITHAYISYSVLHYPFKKKGSHAPTLLSCQVRCRFGGHGDDDDDDEFELKPRHFPRCPCFLCFPRLKLKTLVVYDPR